MTRQRYIIPGAEYIDAMRKQLSRLEMEFAGAELPDHMTISLALVSIENNRAYLEGAIYEELSNRSGAEIGIQQM